MEETTLYSDSDTTVTSTRFVTGATTYAMAQITSVTAVTLPRKQQPLGCGLILVILGLPVAIVGKGEAIGMIALAIGAALLAIYFLSKAKYVVSIGTSGGQVQALISTDAVRVKKIADALTQAIVNRR